MKNSIFQQFSEVVDLPDTDNVSDSPTSFDNQLDPTLHFNQPKTYNRNTQTKYCSSRLNQDENSCPSEAYGNSHSDLFLVHHR